MIYVEHAVAVEKKSASRHEGRSTAPELEE
jgi:hypothetical protein